MSIKHFTITFHDHVHAISSTHFLQSGVLLCLQFCNCMGCRTRNPTICICKTKTQISCAVTTELISAFVFATQIVQSLFFLNLKFQASSLLLWQHSMICVRPNQKPKLFDSDAKAHTELLVHQRIFGFNSFRIDLSTVYNTLFPNLNSSKVMFPT